MESGIGHELGYWALAPFGLMLAATAVLPAVAHGWFERNANKLLISLVLGIPTVVFVITRFGGDGLDLVGSTAADYVSFIVLLTALFAISGGVFLSGNLVATPRVNFTLLLVGAVLANLVGTMGASMLLIRPLLRANSERVHGRHTIIFFIFTVANVGGLLTPLGDPPLFLGYLRGVPFTWTLRLWPQWLLALGLTLLLYVAVEIRQYRREPAQARRVDKADYVPMRLVGWVHVLFFGLAVGTVLVSGPLEALGERLHFPFLREVILIALTVLSVKSGRRGSRAANSFSWSPMIEVSVIFAGIFATMIPALALLEARGASLGLTNTWQYFWATGWLSAFLDNAPTYLALAATAQGQLGIGSLAGLTATQSAGALAAPADFLAAISCGAVMMGALTYLGNAPNFAVRCVAEQSGLKMPSFFGFLAYAAAALLPIFGLVTVIFFL